MHQVHHFGIEAGRVGYSAANQKTIFFSWERNMLAQTKKIVVNVFSAPLHLWVSMRKRVKGMGFTSGLIIGAILSFAVNVATVQIQDELSKQKFLEALEREIISHHTLINSFVNEYQPERNATPDEYNPEERRLYTALPTTVWDNNDVFSYLHSLDANLQADISVYYSWVVPAVNKAISTNDAFIGEAEKAARLCSVEQMAGVELDCNEQYRRVAISDNLVGLNTLVWMEPGMSQNVRILEEFSPINDRRHNLFLKLFMGDDVPEIFHERPVAAQ